MRKKLVDKNEMLGLRLTLAERKLILEDPIHIHDEIADPIRATLTGFPVLLTLDQLEDLDGYVAAEANHTTDKKLRKKLDAILSKIQNLLETHADEEPHKSLKIEDAQREKPLAKQSLQLAEWSAKILVRAEQLGIKTKPVARFPLPGAERATPPTLVLVGTADRLMPQGDDFVRRAKEVGFRGEMFTAADQPHGFFNRPPWQQQTTARVDVFLTSLGYLKEAKELQEKP